MKQVILGVLAGMVIQSLILLAAFATPVGAHAIRGQVSSQIEEVTTPRLDRLDSTLWELRVFLKGTTAEEKATYAESPWLLLPLEEQEEGTIIWQRYRAGLLSQHPVLTRMQTFVEDANNQTSLVGYLERSARWQDDAARWQEGVSQWQRELDLWIGETDKRLRNLEVRIAAQASTTTTAPRYGLSPTPSPSRSPLSDYFEQLRREEEQRRIAREEIRRCSGDFLDRLARGC